MNAGPSEATPQVCSVSISREDFTLTGVSAVLSRIAPVDLAASRSLASPASPGRLRARCHLGKDRLRLGLALRACS